MDARVIPFLSLPTALLGATLLVLQVRALLRWLREREIARLPFGRSSPPVPLEAGAVALAIDRPRAEGWSLPTGSGVADALLGTSRLRYVLVSESLQRVEAGRPPLAGVVQTGGVRIRYTVARFAVPEAGRYWLEVEGLEPGALEPDIAWILLRGESPVLFPLRIVGLVAAAAAMIAGVVFAALSVSGAL